MKHYLFQYVHALKVCMLLCIFFQANSYAQVNLTQSNLPIVIINTDINPATGQPTEIPDEPKIPASMKIIYHTDGSTNYVSDQNNDDFLDYDGRIKIEIRGSTSQDLPKKQYSWTTYEDDDQSKQKVKILGMPKQNDWILNGLAFDASLIRDYLSYNLSRSIGYYAVRTHYCEVILNGQYNGLYILQEKLKDDSNRINIEEIDEDASEGIALTGGYITKADKTTGGDPVAWTMDSYSGYTEFIHDLPKPEDVTPEQNNYIHQQFINLQNTSANGNTNLINGYPSIIDIPTFVDFMVMNELASNVDAYQISTFFHKDIGGKLRAGPIWDFNLTFDNDLFMYGFDRSHTDVWQFDNNDNDGPKFWKDLFDNPEFKCYFSRRWNTLTANGEPLNITTIENFIDETVALISDAAAREHQKWGTVPDWAGEINNLKGWLAQRVTWVTNHAGSYSSCENPELPQLVITGINYHPSESDEFPESDVQEFIQITNTGTSDVDLTGIYLRELGVSYQFPAGSTIAAGQAIYLVNNSDFFQAKYGVQPFGEYQRDLSNSSQNIVLADGFGNIIDRVEYEDESPWPDADGSGYYLHLISNTSDNSQASSWEAIAEETLNTPVFNTPLAASVYPNPVHSEITIQAADAIQTVEIFDVYGKLLKQYTLNDTTLKFDVSRFSQGIYFIKVTCNQGTLVKKIVKN